MFANIVIFLSEVCLQLESKLGNEGKEFADIAIMNLKGKPLYQGTLNEDSTALPILNSVCQLFSV
jgi:hypothetical protein